MHSLYLKPSGRFYYVSFFAAFLITAATLIALAPILPFNAYQAVLLLLVLAVLASGAVFIRYQAKYIHIEDDMMTVRDGLVMSRISMIPLSKVSEVKTQYSLFDKLLGTGTIMFDTAGTGKIEIVFDHVPKESLDSFMSIYRSARAGKGMAQEDKW